MITLCQIKALQREFDLTYTEEFGYITIGSKHPAWELKSGQMSLAQFSYWECEKQYNWDLSYALPFGEGACEAGGRGKKRPLPSKIKDFCHLPQRGRHAPPALKSTINGNLQPCNESSDTQWRIDDHLCA